MRAPLPLRSSSHWRPCRPRAFGRAGVLFLAACLSGCASAPLPLFEPLPQPLVWPPPPEPVRIQYTGQLRTEDDLRPGRSLGEILGEVIFGKGDIRSMLTPYSVTGDGAGERPAQRIFVCDSNAQLVHVFDLATRRYKQWKPEGDHTPFAQPVGIAFDPGPPARLLVSDPVVGALYAFDDGGRGVGWIAEGAAVRPTGIAVDHQRRRIYIADTGAHQIVVTASDGVPITRIGERGSTPGTFNFPTNIALDTAGRIYISDSLNFRVQVFGPDLAYLRQIGERGNRPGYFSQPRGIAVDRHGHTYIIDAHFEAVQIFDERGQLLLSFGEEGRGPGQFWLPTGIYIGADDRIWIADSYNKRVQVFDYRHIPADSPRADTTEAQP